MNWQLYGNEKFFDLVTIYEHFDFTPELLEKKSNQFEIYPTTRYGKLGYYQGALEYLFFLMRRDFFKTLEKRSDQAEEHFTPADEKV